MVGAIHSGASNRRKVRAGTRPAADREVTTRQQASVTYSISDAKMAL